MTAGRIAPASRESVKTPRKRLSKYAFAVIFMRQKGLCGCDCGEPLEDGQIDEEHGIALAAGGTNPYPDSLWRRSCHKAKTAKDRGTISKANRQAGKTGQQARRKRNGPKLKSRGFTGHRKFNGEIVRREGR